MLSQKALNIPDIHENVPVDGNAFSKKLGCFILRMMGWRFHGQLPPHKKVIIAAGIHTSNWDFIVVMAAKLALGVHFSYLMKKEAFIWPLAGLFKKWGGVPIDRANSDGIVEQITTWIHDQDKAWVAITPEGTRAKVTKWKTGFLRIAASANVPVFIVSWDFPSKTLHIIGEWPLTGDHDKDAEEIRQHLYAHYQGKHTHLH